MNSSALTSPSSSSSDATNINQKIHNDLQIVVDKMNGCETLLKTTTTPTHELLTVIGFLEACQPRMIELVEAAAQGALSETVLMECLQVNDRLTKILNDVDTNIDFNASADPSQFVIQDEAEDLLLMEDLPPAASAPLEAAGPKTTGEDLDDLLDLNGLDELALGDDGGVKPTKSIDEFDDFISSRQT